MINLESYVCTLEQAKKLDKLLGKRESIFYWIEHINSRVSGISPRSNIEGDPHLDGYCFFSAYTSQELDDAIYEITGRFFYKTEQNIHSRLHTFWISDDVWCPMTWSDIPGTQARAEFLIYLLEGKSE